MNISIPKAGTSPRRNSRHRADRNRALIICTRPDGLKSDRPERKGNRRIVLDEGYECVRFFSPGTLIPKGEGDKIFAQSNVTEYYKAHEVARDMLLRWAARFKTVKTAIPAISFWIEPVGDFSDTSYVVRFAMPHFYTVVEAMALGSRLGTRAVFMLADYVYVAKNLPDE
jgi:hypothetical protein